MPLSEQEKRALEQLEAQLAAEDPRFASVMVSDPHRARKRRRVLLGALACFVGVGLLVLAVVVQAAAIGAAGFLAIVLGVSHAIGEPGPHLRAVPQQASARAGDRPLGHRGGGLSRARKTSSNGDFMARLEERWERRRRESQGW